MASTEEPNEGGIPTPDEPGPKRHRRFVRKGIVPLGERGSRGEEPRTPLEALAEEVEAREEPADRLSRRPRSKRGLFIFFAVVAGIGSVVTIFGFFALEWTETEGFCSRCHTMKPQVKAYKRSAHSDVACGECHVKPGIGGWVKAKVNGTKQLFQVVTGSYPKPISSPDHAMLPPGKDTCMQCHALDGITREGRPTKIILRPHYRKDRRSTPELVAIIVRPSGLGERSDTRGAHWHVEQRVEFASPDEHSRKIDWVRAIFKNGRSKQFIAQSKVGVSSDIRPEIERLRRTDTTRRMDCIDCHNRVGHDIPSPDRAIDDAIAAGRISRDLPYIKREGLSRVSARYKSVEAADRAIAGVRKTYAARYPLVLKNRGGAVGKAIDELKLIYRLVATPEMKATARTYPNNLGHRTSRGCFRCHDGSHFQVVKGRVTKRTIPGACSTCHTFPQVGSRISSVPLRGKPTGHKAGSQILFSHSAEITRSGRQACMYCHQRNQCTRCHKDRGVKPATARANRKRKRLRDGG